MIARGIIQFYIGIFFLTKYRQIAKFIKYLMDVTQDQFQASYKYIFLLY